LEHGAAEHRIEGIRGEDCVELLGADLLEALIRTHHCTCVIEQRCLWLGADDLAIGDESGDDGREVAGPTADVEQHVVTP